MNSLFMKQTFIVHKKNKKKKKKKGRLCETEINEKVDSNLGVFSFVYHGKSIMGSKSLVQFP